MINKELLLPFFIKSDNVLLVAENGHDETGARGSLSPFRTPQAAIDAAYSGDCILIAPGSYAGDLTLIPGIKLLGLNSVINGDISWTAISGDDEVVKLADLTINGTINFDATGKSGGTSLFECRECRLQGDAVALCRPTVNDDSLNILLSDMTDISITLTNGSHELTGIDSYGFEDFAKIDTLTTDGDALVGAKDVNFDTVNITDTSTLSTITCYMDSYTVAVDAFLVPNFSFLFGEITHDVSGYLFPTFTQFAHAPTGSGTLDMSAQLGVTAFTGTGYVKS